MLVLTRKPGEQIFIEPGIIITVLSSTKGGTRIGITAPKDQRITRPEAKEEVAKRPEEVADTINNR